MATPAEDPANKTKQPEDEKKQVKYDTFKLSVPEIIAALHQKAVAAVSDKTIRIANSAIESDGKQTKLNSAGQHIVSVLPVEDGKMVAKDLALASLQTYVQWFVGPDLSKKVTDKVILPLGNGEEEGGTTSESAKPISFMELFLESLNEADDDAEDVADQEDSDEADEEDDPGEEGDGKSVDNAGEGEEDADDASDGDAEQEIDDGKEYAPGWYIAYNLKVQGLKETSLKDAMKDFVVKFFDDLTITPDGLFGSGKAITGKDIRKQFHDLKHIDHNKLAENVSQYLSKKFPKVQELDVKARDSKTLYREIKSYPSLTKDDKAAITAAAYCLCIKVKEDNPQKPFLNKVKIAEAIKQGMGFFRIGKKAKVTKDSIIKIENFTDVNDEQSFANNAKRPDASVIKELLNKKEYKGDSKGNLDYTSGLELFNKIKKLFAGISKNKKAMEEEKNKEAMAILKKLEDKCSKVKDGETFLLKDFNAFYEEYLKFEANVGESMPSASLIAKINVAKLIFEMLFEDADELTPRQMLEADEDDAEEVDDEGDDGASEDAQPVATDPNYQDFTTKLKAAVKTYIRESNRTAVLSKEDALDRLDTIYKNDISKLQSSDYKSFAVIDFHPKSIIPESVEEKLLNILFEENSGESGENADSLQTFVTKAFKKFKTDAPVPEEQAGSMIILETSLEESLTSHGRSMLLEAKDLLTQIEDDITTAAIKLGKTKMKNPKLHNTYDVKAGSSKEVTEYLKSIGIGSSSDYEKIESKEYAVAIVVKQPKETEEKMHNGSPGAAAFTDDAVKKAYQDSFNGSTAFEFLSLAGTSSSIKYYNSKTNADVKVFVAAFDEEIKDDVHVPDDEDKKPKPDETPDKKGNTARAFILPFTLMKAPGKTPDGDDEPESPKTTPSPSNGKQAGGIDLYIFPIESSKDFEESPDLEK